ncbi:S41 family peptidase [Undibacterium sp. TS12]|uniref:S41 family peptidase n=1 Tax=Undibacterium sp. TS12 TaxID=2908202 RepID=UPI001F4D3575|nr:S41 family peptidase [Undibacterium sp. TS12]MCH8619142.1 S41 family peptidase [Undibacterium sp. TS12]
MIKKFFGFSTAILLVVTTHATNAATVDYVPTNQTLTPRFDTASRPGQLHNAWQVEGKSTSISLQVDTRAGNKGRVLLLHNRVASQSITLSQQIDARPWRGKIVEICGDIKVDTKADVILPGKSGLWIRTDIIGGSLRLAGTYQLPLSGNWQRACASIAVDRAANQLSFGTDSDSKGKIWFANLHVRETANVARSRIDDPGSRALTAGELQNLHALAKAVGYIRYFHASDAATKLHWSKFIQKAVPVVAAAQSAKELAQILQHLFEPYAPDAQWLEQALTPKEMQRPDAASYQLKWVHYGLAQRSDFYHSERVYETLDTNVNNSASTKHGVQLNQFALNKQVSLWMPAMVFADQAKKTIPVTQADSSLNLPDLPLQDIEPDFSGNDRITRLGNAMQAWNALRHFYPYNDIIEIAWDKELDKLLQSASSDQDEKAFTHTLMRFVSVLRDSHARITGPREQDTHVPRVKIKMVNGVPIVANFRFPGAPDAEQLIPFGSEIIALNDQAVGQRLAVILEENAAATATSQAGIFGVELLLGPKNSRLSVRYKDMEGREHDKMLVRDADVTTLNESSSLKKVQHLDKGIWYVNVDEASETDIDQLLAKSGGTNVVRGIIFDVRDYVNVSSSFLKYFSKAPLIWPLFNIPVVSKPDQVDMLWKAYRAQIQPGQPHRTAKLVFLISEKTVSAAETLMSMVEYHKLGAIVGTETAGSNGNISVLPLPGGYKVFWTGMQALKQDGSRFHGIGIIPTVRIGDSFADVISGRDVVLEKALQLFGQ